MAVMAIGNPSKETFSRFPSLTKNRIVLETLLENRRTKDKKMKRKDAYVSNVESCHACEYGVALVSRINKILGLLFKSAL